MTDLLSVINLDFDIIALSETWLQNNQNFQPIENYCSVHNCRSDKSGGGVALLLKNEINFKLRKNLGINNFNIMETIFVEIRECISWFIGASDVLKVLKIA